MKQAETGAEVQCVPAGKFVIFEATGPGGRLSLALDRSEVSTLIGELLDAGWRAFGQDFMEET